MGFLREYTPRILKILKFRVWTVFVEYKDFLVSTFKNLPKLIWGAFAVIGILVIGILLGIYFYTRTSDIEDPEIALFKENAKLRNLIEDYEELSELYFKQGENVGIVLDPDVYYSNPDQTYEAVLALKQFREMIIDKQREIESQKKDIKSF